MKDKRPVSARRVTAADVAERAGVSPSTVSKALSGRGAVRLETRQLILNTAADIGYRPPHAPLPLLESTGATGTVGVIMEDRFGRLTVPVLQGIIGVFAENDVAMVLVDGRGDSIREGHYVESLARRGVEGIVVVGAGLYPREPLRETFDLPVVYALSWTGDPADACVVADDADGARLAARHLAVTGRHRVAFISGPERDAASRTRFESTQSVVTAAGGEIAHEPLFGEWSERWGRQATKQLLRAQEDFDAIVCGSDQIARGVLEALRENDVHVPQDVAVTGFDNWEVMVEASRPPLTTVDMSLGDVGATAARAVLRARDGGFTPGTTSVPCQLVPRESTALY